MSVQRPLPPLSVQFGAGALVWGLSSLEATEDGEWGTDVLDAILEGQFLPSELTRTMISVNALHLSTYALNDILVAHPCPASVSRFSFRYDLSNLMHGLIKDDQTLVATWTCRKGVIYIDGSHIYHTIQDGDIIEISSKAPVLKVLLPHHLL
ncbi:hypothetical protein V8G54_027635 [Vigna mungo]|uniref:Uncharacterized protein n=1 Tax=Vigna mungo TaxID=3915 RepID=A0AAQ3N374_VIGMU